MPPELLELYEYVTASAAQLKSYGAHQDEITKKAGTAWFRGLSRLQARGIDISARPLLFSEYRDPTPEDDISRAPVVRLRPRIAHEPEHAREPDWRERQQKDW